MLDTLHCKEEKKGGNGTRGAGEERARLLACVPACFPLLRKAFLNPDWRGEPDCLLSATTANNLQRDGCAETHKGRPLSLGSCTTYAVYCPQVLLRPHFGEATSACMW